MIPIRKILLTGGSRGIGLACLQRCLDAGHHVVTLSRTAPPRYIEPMDSGSLHHIPIDLSDIEAVTEVLDALLKETSVDALICNAGRGDIGALENFSSAQIEESLRLNLISPLCIARHVLPTLRKQQRSDIVFIGSTSGLQGARFGSVYSAAKFGLNGIAQALRYETANANCHVGIVHPGMVRSGFFDDLDFEPGPDEAQALVPDDIAKAVMSMLDSADNAVVSELVVRPRQHVVKKKQRVK